MYIAAATPHGFRMKIGVLGPLEVRTDADEPCLPRGPKQRLLLATLLVHEPRAVSSDRLIDALWGLGAPVDPTAALRTQISRLRSCLDGVEAAPDSVLSEPHGYRLDTSAFELDAARFRRLLDESQGGHAPLEELRILSEALALWRGDAYEEFSHLSGFLGAIRELHDLRQGAQERQVECLLQVGRRAEALALAQRLVHADPLRERPAGILMQALYA
jgi:DNA-binding SARP family transcriptional activator